MDVAGWNVAKRWLPALVPLLLAGCSPEGQPAGQASAAPAIPKIVVQLGHQAPVEAVLWAQGGRDLISLGRDGSIVVWDVAHGAVLDHGQVPVAEGLNLASFLPGADGRTASILYTARDGACAPKADGGPGGCAFSLDLATRAVTAMTAATTVTAAPGSARFDPFPLSPDGRYRPSRNHDDGKPGLFATNDDNLQFADATCASLTRCRYGVTLTPVQGDGPPILLTGMPRSYFLDADISADGRQLLRVEGIGNDTETRVEAIDLTNGARHPAFVPQRAYHHVTWLDERRYALLSDGYRATDDTPDASGFPATLVVDPACANANRRTACASLPAYAFMQAIDDEGGFVGAGSLADCFRAGTGVGCLSDTGVGPPRGDRLSFARSGGGDGGGGGWVVRDLPVLAGQAITALDVAGGRRRIAVATQAQTASGPRVRVYLAALPLDAAPRLLAELPPAADGDGAAGAATIEDMGFTPDGDRLLFTWQGALHLVPTSGDGPARTMRFASRRFVASNDRVFGLDDRALVDAATGKAIGTPLAVGPLARAGFIVDAHLLWAASADGTIHVWNSDDGSPQLALYSLPDNRFFAVTPDGRYDTNLGPDSDQVRWLMSDAPWRSLSAQTFMRDYYEPGLYRKLLDCNAAKTCTGAFRPLPAIGSLNRVLPSVRITGVRPGRTAAEAVVSFEVAEGSDPAAANGKTRSGIYNPRLYLDNRLVAFAPDEPDRPSDTLAVWRRLNDVAGVRSFSFTVPVPTGPGTARQLFSAYAFNEDRIKSETATYVYERPVTAPRTPRAFVVNIGIDDYDTPRLRLNYSVADARLLAGRLAGIPGYETRQLTLAGERRADGTRARVDGATIEQALDLIASDDRRAATLAALRRTGVDAAVLEAATPDDIVIISFSGHGWADSQGNFYLIPTNGLWKDGSETPDLASVVSTAALTKRLRATQAGEIALIIDACHSAASVDGGAFKPGPMGDSGLGQLAYDKGIRILAATQADDVAFEDDRLKQGLLTYALAGEGLTGSGGAADSDGDGRIRLDEWLAYAVERLPALSKDARMGALAPAVGARGVTFLDLAPTAPRRRIQKPSLFDFNAAPSAVVLRRLAR